MSKPFLSLVTTNLFLIVGINLQAQHFEGKIEGKVFDFSTKAPLEYASAAIYHVNDSVPLNGTVTDTTGYFAISGIRPGLYTVRITFIGYPDKAIDSIRISPKNPVRHLGNIYLKPDGKLLDEFTITEEKNVVQYGIDKKVYNVDKDLTTKGGTATDVLGNIPSVQVDADRNITYRGNGNVRVLIDGKPTALTGGGSVLDQIPAENIERIEIISNPSSKYDAEGTTGIINIITKKGSKKGSSGNVSFNAGTGDKYNSNLMLSHAKGNSSWTFNYGWQQMNHWTAGNAFRATTFDSVADLAQQMSGYRKGQGHNAKLAYDYQLNKRNLISASFGINTRRGDDIDRVFYSFMNEGVVDSTSQRVNNETDRNDNYDAYIGWKKSYDREGRSLSAEANWSSGAGEENLNAHQNYMPGYMSVSRFPDQQITRSLNNNYTGTFQIDYSDAPSKEARLETGAKSTIRRIEADFTSDFYDYSNESFQRDLGRSNLFIFAEQVYAVYGNYTGKVGRFGYSGGIRFEETFYIADQVTTKQYFTNDYFSFFPSAFVTYEIKKGRDLQASYSRRIRRPNSHELNPFPEYDDPYNLRMGNPLLKPEYIDSYEANYVRTGKKSLLSFTAYMRYTHGSITRFRRITPEGISLTITENLNNQQSVGVEAVAQLDLFKWWKLNGNINVYNLSQNAGNLSQGLTRSAWAGMGRVMNNFKAGKTWDIQMSYHYMQPGWALQGTIQPFHSMDIAVKKDFWKGNASALLRISDVFNTREFNIQTATPEFSQSFMRKRESRIVNLTLSYRFGNGAAPARKGKKQGNGGEGEMMEFE